MPSNYQLNEMARFDPDGDDMRLIAGDPGNDYYFCPVCSREFKTEYGYLTHVTHHIEDDEA